MRKQGCALKRSFIHLTHAIFYDQLTDMDLKPFAFEDVDLIFTPSRVKSGRGLTQDELTVNFQPEKFARIKLNDEFEGNIAKIWHERTSENSKIFNASKFRYIFGHHLPKTISSFFSYFDLKRGEETNQLVLDLGLTDYRHLLGTHYSPKLPDTLNKLKLEGKGCQILHLPPKDSVPI